jgi:hypothetical protein
LPDGHPQNKSVQSLFLLPGGEGQVEGGQKTPNHFHAAFWSCLRRTIGWLSPRPTGRVILTWMMSPPSGALIYFYAAGVKLFQAVAFFDFSVGESRFAFVAHAGFSQIKIIVQVLQFLAQRGDLLALPGNGANNGLFRGFSHKHLFDCRFCELQ